MGKTILLLFACLLVGSIDGKPGEYERLGKGQLVDSANPRVAELARPTTPPPSASVSCQSIVAYYDGVFNNYVKSTVKCPVQFQMRATSNLFRREYQLTVEGWNETLSQDDDFFVYLGYDGSGEACPDLTVNKTCSVPFFIDGGYFDLDLFYKPGKKVLTGFSLLHFEPFNRTFTFNAIGQCTKNPPTVDDEHAPERSLYQVCMCCDNYNPHPALNCPKSPWA